MDLLGQMFVANTEQYDTVYYGRQWYAPDTNSAGYR